ncbi:unnamed protein product [Tenebrio molitor]|nr:unnamed protein product [Tenebrio molitor]
MERFQNEIKRSPVINSSSINQRWGRIFNANLQHFILR